jgi:hypothetical protein
MNAFNSSSVRLVTAVAVGVLWTSFASPVIAQSICDSCSTEAEISAYLNTQAQPPTVQGSNSATIVQYGSNNTATSDATVPSSVPLGTGSYFGNVTLQAQIGTNNVSNVEAVGNFNTLATFQLGNDNNTSITAYGSDNSFSSTQIGTGLSYTLQRVGSGQSISVFQKN